VINIVLTNGDATIVDQYTLIMSKICPLLHDQGVDLDDLREDDKKQDITYLTRETNISQE
jgi:hypothetical protein